MKRLLVILTVLVLACALVSCKKDEEENTGKKDVITVEDGYLVVNGVKTEYEVKNNNHSFGEWKLYNEDETNCEKSFTSEPARIVLKSSGKRASTTTTNLKP